MEEQQNSIQVMINNEGRTVCVDHSPSFKYTRSVHVRCVFTVTLYGNHSVVIKALDRLKSKDRNSLPNLCTELLKTYRSTPLSISTDESKKVVTVDICLPKDTEMTVHQDLKDGTLNRLFKNVIFEEGKKASLFESKGRKSEEDFHCKVSFNLWNKWISFPCTIDEILELKEPKMSSAEESDSNYSSLPDFNSPDMERLFNELKVELSSAMNNHHRETKENMESKNAEIIQRMAELEDRLKTKYTEESIVTRTDIEKFRGIQEEHYARLSKENQKTKEEILREQEELLKNCKRQRKKSDEIEQKLDRLTENMITSFERMEDRMTSLERILKVQHHAKIEETKDSDDGIRFILRKLDDMNERSTVIQEHLYKQSTIQSERMRDLEEKIGLTKSRHEELLQKQYVTPPKVITHKLLARKALPPRAVEEGRRQKLASFDITVSNSQPTNDDLLDIVNFNGNRCLSQSSLHETEEIVKNDTEATGDKVSPETIFEKFLDQEFPGETARESKDEPRLYNNQHDETCDSLETYSNDLEQCIPDCVEERDSEILEFLNIAELENRPCVMEVIGEALQVPPDPSRHRGMDTVLCIDTSASITDKLAQQLKSTVLNILTTIEDVAVTQCLEENVAMVTFGKENRILHHLGTDYSAIQESTDGLEFGGTSPMLTGLLMAYMILKNYGGPTFVSDFCVPPRIILFSDGRATDDAYLDNDALEFTVKGHEIGRRLEMFAEKLGQGGCQIYTVGVGQQVNFTLLEEMARVSGGKYFQMDNVSYLANYFRYQFIAGKTIQRCRESGMDLEYRDVLDSENVKHRYNLDSDELDVVAECMEQSEELLDEELPDYPTLGSRILVMDDQTGESYTGTVVKHKKQGRIKIILDVGEIWFIDVNCFKSSSNISILQNHPRRLPIGDIVAVGTWVVKANKSASDVLSVGSVFEKSVSGYIKVRWHGDNGYVERCKFVNNPEISIHAACLSEDFCWLYEETEGEWRQFPSEEILFLENLFNTKGENRTRTVTLLNERVRIIFKDKVIRFLEQDKTFRIRRTTD